ncbi:MAG: ABC transporter substrate-binding protein [Leptolyngbyaceae cyanobacterium SM1_1_3]|nr:ABC transporter substrate-binding protein [Leptolyngbyaceae cyanobacterium SM1_1_3]NJN01217.1 ABC transporter substrate-binding protein [Leptolyngbyaceae cyanobacterium RM1_1_2]
MIWFKRLSIGIIAALAIALSSCQVLLVKTEAAQGSQLVADVLSDPKTFNYALNSQRPNIFSLTFAGLTSVNGLTAEIEPELAESWEMSADRLHFVFTLRDNLKWSDGEPLTADDVVFTYEQIVFNPEIPSGVSDMLKIGQSGQFPQIKKLSDRQVEFTLPEPFAPFLFATAGPSDGVAIMPKHALAATIEAKGADGNPIFLSTWGTNTPPEQIVGNGPYRLSRYRPSERVVFERNPYYWRQDTDGNPQPYIDRYIWEVVESTTASLIQFRSGGTDAIGVAANEFALLKREEERGSFKIYNGGPAFGTTFISFNLNQGSRNGKPLVDPIKSGWFTQVEFRQAIAYALDRQTMLNNLFQGLGQLQHSPIDIQSPFYLSPEQGLKVYDYNPDKARELLQSSGFQYNAAGQLLDAAGNRVRFTLMTNAGNKLREGMGAQVKQDLSQIGIQVDFQPIDFSTLVEKLSVSLDWDCYLLGFTGGIEPNEGANVWLPEGNLHSFNQSAQAGQDALEGRTVYDWERQIGDLYIQAAQTYDLAQRQELYDEAQRLTQEYLPCIYLINPLSLAAVRNSVEDVQFSALKGIFWNIYEVRMSENS